MSNPRLIMTFASIAFATMVLGCGSEPAEKIPQAPITSEMERQAEASSNYMMEQGQPKKPQAK